MRLFDLVAGETFLPLRGVTGFVSNLVFTPDGKFVFGILSFGLGLWDVSSGEKVLQFKGALEANSIAISRDGKLGLTGGGNGKIQLWEMSTAFNLRIFKGHTGPIHSVAVSPDGKLAMSGSEDGTVRFWHVETGRQLRAFNEHAGPIYSVAFSPNGTLALSGSKDRTIIIWNLKHKVLMKAQREADRIGAKGRRERQAAARKRENERSRKLEAKRKEEIERRERMAALTRKIVTPAWRDPQTGMEFLKVPGGSFQMGCHANAGVCRDNEKPARTVRLNSFWMGKFEVTQGQWTRIMGANPSRFKKGDNYPVERVSWNDAQGFIRRLNRNSAFKFRLPSEAEWEYACRSGGRQIEYGTETGLAPPGSVNSWNHNKKVSLPVGSFKANPLGFHDMSGNVHEWVEDKKTGYEKVRADNPVYEGSGKFRGTRGGSFLSGNQGLRCTDRENNYVPKLRYDFLGFRLVRVR